MLLKIEKRCAQAVSKISGMSDAFRQLPAQQLSGMSEMTKMYFINEKLNCRWEAGDETALRKACPECPDWKEMKNVVS